VHPIRPRHSLSCYRDNAVGPQIEDAALLHIVGRAVLNARDTGFMATDVIDDGLDDVRLHAKVGHACDRSAP
jgi:hypothetical protein